MGVWEVGHGDSGGGTGGGEAGGVGLEVWMREAVMVVVACAAVEVGGRPLGLRKGWVPTNLPLAHHPLPQILTQLVTHLLHSSQPHSHSPGSPSALPNDTTIHPHSHSPGSPATLPS